VRTIITNNVTRLQHSHTASGIVGVVAIALALWSASNYVAAFMRASNAIYDVPEGRPIWKTAPVRLAVTIVTMVLLVAAAVIVAVTGGWPRRSGTCWASDRWLSPSGTSPSGRCCWSSSA
jgi:membrane protein